MTGDGGTSAEAAPRVDGIVDQPNMTVVANITEVDPADYAWDHAGEFVPGATGTTAFQRPGPQAILDWYVEPYVLRDASGLERRPAIRLSWDGSLPGISGVSFAVRLKIGDCVG